MKKLLLVLLVLLCFNNLCFADENLSVKELNKIGIVANSNIKKSELVKAQKIILELQKQTLAQIKNGYGPFLAAIYDNKGNLIAQMPNTVIKDQCSLNHAEMNTIRAAQKKLKSYNLAPNHLSIYITAEPCMMCAGGIMWSGINTIYYSVSSKDVEEITGFDEGYKPNWLNAFKKRHIKVYGNIEANTGKSVLKQYINDKNESYKPSRN